MVLHPLVKLLFNTRSYRFDATARAFIRHSSLLIDGKRIVALDTDAVGTGAERIDLQGATVLPAFADCHVHLPETGYYAGDRSLAQVRTYDDFVQAVASIPRDGEVVYAGRYDDARWIDGRIADSAPLDRYHPDVRAMLVRIDGHSSIVNRRTFAWLDLPPDTEGIERAGDGTPTGKLVLEANWRAQTAFVAAIPRSMRHAFERRAVDIARAHGVAHLHAQLLGIAPGEHAFELERLRTLPAKIYPKICEPDARLASDNGLPFIGGDVFLDGSIGSCTAALHDPYEKSHETGSLRFSDDALLAYFSGAEALGVAAGVHAIGDAAIEQCLRVWERVLAGKPSTRGARHFIEHFEMASDEHIDACARMNIYLSMQPQFDATWGEAGGMYERRLGIRRKQTMNAFRRIVGAGATLCGGSDSPVCALDPLAGMQACLEHHELSQRLNPHEALALYTVNAARFGYVDTDTGNVMPGYAADLVVLDGDPIDAGSFASCSVIETWIDGEVA